MVWLLLQLKSPMVSLHTLGQRRVQARITTLVKQAPILTI